MRALPLIGMTLRPHITICGYERELGGRQRHADLRSGAAKTGTLATQVADHIGSARSYLTLSTLAAVLQSWDDRPHHRLIMPLPRFLVPTMGALAGPSALRV